MAALVSDEKNSHAGICGRADYHMFCDNGIVCYPAEGILWGCPWICSGIRKGNSDVCGTYAVCYFISSRSDGESAE